MDRSESGPYLATSDVQGDAAPFAGAREPVQKRGILLRHLEQLVAPFGLLLHEDEGRVSLRALQRLIPDLADPFVNEVADREPVGDVSCM